MQHGESKDISGITTSNWNAINWTPDFLWVSPVPPLMYVFCSKIRFMTCVAFSHHSPLVFSNLWLFLGFSLSFMTLTLLLSSDKEFCGISLYLCLSDLFFYWTNFKYSRQNSITVGCPSLCTLLGAHGVNTTYYCGDNCDRLVTVVSASFLHITGAISAVCPRLASPQVQPTFKGRGI